MKMPWLISSIAALAWIVSLALAAFLGFKYRNITDKITSIEVELQKRVVKKEAEPKKSSVIDPSDLAQQIQYEQDEINRKLNA